MDKKALLDELKIDRTAAEPSGRPLKWFVFIAVVGGAGFVAWFLSFPPTGELVPINTVVARAVSQAPAGSSVLDATGYVVARRMATVSSKITGKVMEVFIEEGLLVEKGQLLVGSVFELNGDVLGAVHPLAGQLGMRLDCFDYVGSRDSDVARDSPRDDRLHRPD